jgi:hypothetical protein
MSKILACIVVSVAVLPSFGAVTPIDNFEIDEGHFAVQPTFSSTSASLATTSTSDRVTDTFFQGIASQKLVIDDIAGTAPDGSAWRVRHLSGGGTPANNVSISALGYVGYYIKATQGVGLQASIVVESPTETERGAYFSIPSDGNWYRVQWDFANATHWDLAPFGTTDGTITSSTVTIDSLWLRSTVVSGDQDATIYIDNVAFDSAGQLPVVPEPSSAVLAVMGGLAILAGRMRRY